MKLFYKIEIPKCNALVYMLLLVIMTISMQVKANQQIVSFQVQELNGASHINEHTTFGHVFKSGDVAAGNSIVAELNNGTEIPLQVNVKSTHANGSIRHAILSLKLPAIAANEIKVVSLKQGQNVLPGNDLQLIDLTSSGFTASVNFVLNGQNFTATLNDGILAGNVTNWLQGPLAAEWLVRASVKDSLGNSHPHLTVRFNIRTYAGYAKTKVDVIVENNWSYVPSPQNITYDVSVYVSGQSVYSKTALEHFHHARWKKTFWDNGEPGLDVIFDKEYLMQTRALPNYDLSLQISEATLVGLESDIAASNTEPMGIAVINPNMPAPGGRPDIGPEHKWTALYLLSMDKRAQDGTKMIAHSAGSWPIHYRDMNTDLPIRIADYPYMTLGGSQSDTYNPNTGQFESFPDCNNCNSPYVPDRAHQPSFAYVPYLITGDHFYLEELMFWASYNILWANPTYRNHDEGLLKSEQVRGQAWALRTLGQLAYIMPDDHTDKNYYNDMVDNNVAYYNARYSDNSGSNQLGIATESYAFPYNGGRGSSPWMDDFFTWSIGYLKALDFQNASHFLEWKATSSIERMTNTDYCWVLGSPYSMIVRNDTSSPLYTTYAQVYDATVDVRYPEANGLECGSQAMANALGLDLGEMVGFSSSTVGYPSNMQPALAVATEISHPNAALAWQVFDNRSVKPNYALAPQFAIVPVDIANLVSVSLTTSSTQVNSGQTVALNWNSNNTNSCVASGGWSGTRDVSGSETSAPITTAANFILNCTGDAGSSSASVTVNVYGGGVSLGSGVIINNAVVYDESNASDWSIQTDLQAGDAMYGDRSYTFSQAPEFLIGQEWLSTANDSRSFVGETLVNFTVAVDTQIFILHRDDIGNKPAWLSDWTDTSSDVVNSEPKTYSIYSRSFNVTEQVSLGNNGSTSSGMYLLVAVPITQAAGNIFSDSFE